MALLTRRRLSRNKQAQTNLHRSLNLKKFERKACELVFYCDNCAPQYVSFILERQREISIRPSVP